MGRAKAILSAALVAAAAVGHAASAARTTFSLAMRSLVLSTDSTAGNLAARVMQVFARLDVSIRQSELRSH